MKISIFGLGYVGAVSLACLARDGHNVIGVVIDPAKLELLRAGKTPVVEEGMVDLMAQVASSGRVEVTTDVQRAVLESDLSLVCVGTPSAANGSQDQTAVLRLGRDIGVAIGAKQDPHTVVFRSTLVPGTVESALRPLIEEASGKRDGDGFFLCFQPEFLREGSSIRDYDNPPFHGVGGAACAAGRPPAGPLRHPAVQVNETLGALGRKKKYCCNNFHAL